MAVVAMSEMGKARKCKWTLGMSFFILGGYLWGVFWCFGLGFCNYYLFSLKVILKRLKTSPK